MSAAISEEQQDQAAADAWADAWYHYLEQNDALPLGLQPTAASVPQAPAPAPNNALKRRATEDDDDATGRAGGKRARIVVPGIDVREGWVEKKPGQNAYCPFCAQRFANLESRNGHVKESPPSCRKLAVKYAADIPAAPGIVDRRQRYENLEEVWFGLHRSQRPRFLVPLSALEATGQTPGLSTRPAGIAPSPLAPMPWLPQTHQWPNGAPTSTFMPPFPSPYPPLPPTYTNDPYATAGSYQATAPRPSPRFPAATYADTGSWQRGAEYPDPMLEIYGAGTVGPSGAYCMPSARGRPLASESRTSSYSSLANALVAPAPPLTRRALAALDRAAIAGAGMNAGPSGSASAPAAAPGQPAQLEEAPQSTDLPAPTPTPMLPPSPSARSPLASIGQDSGLTGTGSSKDSDEPSDGSETPASAAATDSQYTPASALDSDAGDEGEED